MPNCALDSFARIFSASGKSWVSCFLYFLLFSFAAHSASKVRPTVILASLEGTAHTLTLDDEFKVSLDQTSVGKKIPEKTILLTEKNAKAQLLFSNGILITVKPGSRFYLREFDQKIVSSENLPDLSKMEEEPSKSKVQVHLDYGELIVKAPKMKKGSYFKLTSPLGTAGIRGTMFQMIAVRNPVTGDISGGLNLISGEINFSGIDGQEMSLASGQSVQLAQSKLGESMATKVGGLVNLNNVYDSSLSGDSIPPTMDQLFPGYVEGVPYDADSADAQFTSSSFQDARNWEAIHDLATDIFFAIEEAETVAGSFDFDSLANAVTIDVSDPVVNSPVVPPVFAGGPDSPIPTEPFMGAHPTVSLIGEDSMQIELTSTPFSEFDPWIEAKDFLENDLAAQAKLLTPPNLLLPGKYDLEYQVTDLRGLSTSVVRYVEVIATPPVLTINPGRFGYTKENDSFVLFYQVRNNNVSYSNPDGSLADDGSFQILSQPSTSKPYYTAKYYDGSDLTSQVTVLNAEKIDYTILNQETLLNISVNDFSLRQAKLPDGNPVSTSLNVFVRVIDSLPPVLSVSDGASSELPMRVKGINFNISGKELVQAQEVDFSRDLDPGLLIEDNYYSAAEIEQHMGYEIGAGGKESAFGEVDMKVAGVYELVYQNISDPSGNIAEPVSRWVEVYDEDAPLLTLYGANPMYVDLNSTNEFKDPGAFGLDNLEGLIDWETNRFEISVEKLVDDDAYTWAPAESTIEEIVRAGKLQNSLDVTFRLTYRLKDLSGNESFIRRQVVLLNSPYKLPIVVLHGEDPHWHEVNTEFVDPGITAYKEIGEGQEPRNLNEYVTTNAYLLTINETKNPDGPMPIDPTRVNFFGPPEHGETLFYVDSEGNRLGTSDPSWRKQIIRYFVRDPLGNERVVDREVRIVDTTSPVIVLNEGTQGINFPNLQGGFSYKDPGATVTDNYDESVDLISTLLFNGEEGEEEIEFSTVENLGFIKVGSYVVRFEAQDTNENRALAERSIEVIDTIAPQVALVTHGFLEQGQALQSINPIELENFPIVDAEHPIPADITYRSGSDPAGFSSGAFDSNITLTLSSDVDFYVYAKPENIRFEGFENITTDEKGSRGIFSSFYVVDESGQTVLEDPGIYVRNDTDVTVSFSSTQTTVFSPSNPDQIIQYRISYSATQSTGEVSNLPNARNIFIIDTEKPTVFAEPDTSTKQVVVEANRDPLSSNRYTDLAGSIVKLFDPAGDGNASFITGQTLLLRAVDLVDGTISDRIQRIIKNGTGDELGIINDNSSPDSVASAVLSLVDASVLDAEYLIEYTATDIPLDPTIPPNVSNVVTRRLIVKDTMPPDIKFSEFNSTLTVDYKSTTNPNVMDESSVAEYMLLGLSAEDANNFDQDLAFSATMPNGEQKWSITFDPPFVPGAIYPETRDEGLGYKVTIYVSDQSGNVSSGFVRYLKVGDYQPPVITMIGQSEIHDFLRFAQNPGLGNQLPFVDQTASSTNLEVNSTGFAQGEHRMLLADYNFVDPGVYAEDDNAFFDIKDQYPDLDGDGIGEGHLIARVAERSDMDQCSEGPGKIHLYSWFEKNSYTMEDWQKLMGDGNYGYNTRLLPTDANATGSPAKVPDVDGEDLGGGHQFTDLNKTDLTNFDMTTITIEYRVMDGWDNKSEISTRRIYVYESRQFDGFAFFATPLTDASGAPFEQFYDNGSGDPFLTSARKDLDGDGVSDFWEMALGTDYKDPSSKPDLTNHEAYKALHADNLSTTELSDRLSKLKDSSALMNVRGLKDFNATVGL